MASSVSADLAPPQVTINRVGKRLFVTWTSTSPEDRYTVRIIDYRRAAARELPVTGTSVTLPYAPVRVIEVLPHAGAHVGRTPGRARVEDGA